MPDYNPNKEYTQKSLSLGMAAFDKQIERREKITVESPSIYSYHDNSLKGYFNLSNVKKDQQTLEFNK